jgi:hypothetical protein
MGAQGRCSLGDHGWCILGAWTSAFGDWTESESETEVGVFRVLAKATVRPHGRARHSKAGEVHRRSHRTTR